MADITFPQYRKYKNNKSYFMITSWTEFEEITHLPGNVYRKKSFTAKILPDRNLVHDMLTDYAQHWDAINESDYLKIRDLSGN